MPKDNVVEFPGDLDPAQFRISATDTKGHTARKWYNIQPMHSQMMAVLMEAKKFPYRTIGEFTRHAIVRHIHWLESIHQPIKSVTGALDASNAVLRDMEFRSEFKYFIEKLDKQVNILVDEGDIGAARKLVLEVLRHIEDMPEGYWRDKYLGQIRKGHAKLLEGAPKASLLAFSEEGAG
uniref:Uncharacterized protein n=1 Tax=viral metagenome TaxID=1070528 RepID=A0A6M3XWQ3_9ZZZZ